MFSNPTFYILYLAGFHLIPSRCSMSRSSAVTFAAVVVGGLVVVGALTYFRLWGYLWNEWVTSIDHKKIGIMYIILAIIMLLRGFCRCCDDACPASHRVWRFCGLPPATSLRSDLYRPWRDYDLLRGDALVTGLMNFVVPLQIGARDVAFRS